MAIERVYGVEFRTPPNPAISKIHGFNLPRQQQKFVRIDWEKELGEVDFDESGEPVYSEEQLAFIDRELDRIEHGFWFMCNGRQVFMTGLHYFYCTYWFLEDGSQPDYRDADKRYFYFQEYCENLPECQGIIRTKKRREGATSQATADLVRTAITGAKKFCGLVSKTGKDAKTCFLDMVRYGFYNLPIYLKPRVEDEESKTELVFTRKKQTGKKKKVVPGKGSVKAESMGLGSKIDYRTTEMNSYDSGRLSKVLIDETGKFPADVPVNEYWPIVQQTLRMGGVGRGFALMPSTSNKLEKGGKGFKKIWDDSDHFRNKTTGSGLYRYFNPAYDGYAPYIDEFGDSIVGKPTKEQWIYMKKHFKDVQEEMKEMGPKEWLELERSRKKDDDARREHQRMYPFTEKDAFDYEDSADIYDREAIMTQKEWMQDHAPKLRQVTWFRREDGKADWKDDPNGMTWVLKFPEETEANATYERAGKIRPANKHKYVHVADPFKNTIVKGPGSKGCGAIGTKINPLDPENTGMIIALFYGRPKLKREFHKQQLLMAEYYGAEMNYESDYDDYIEFLIGEGKMGYAAERPVNTYNPAQNKKRNPEKKEYGMKSADGFQYAMMIDRSQTYVILYCHKIYFMIILDQLEEYDPEERTKFDAAVVFQLFTVVISDPVKPPKTEKKKPMKIVKTYNLYNKN